MLNKLRVGVIFGGRSGEHEVSLRSAESVINALDKTKYEVIPIAITPQGKWLASSEATNLLPSSVIETADQSVAILGDPTKRGLERISSDGEQVRDPLDVIVPILHGTYGEDGTIQGLFEMADIPYVGCGVLATACGMDKVFMKRLFHEAGLQQAGQTQHLTQNHPSEYPKPRTSRGWPLFPVTLESLRCRVPHPLLLFLAPS